MMAALSWLHTSSDAPPAMLKNAEARADEATSMLRKAQVQVMPEPALASLKKLETAPASLRKPEMPPANLSKPDMAKPADPLHEARVSLFRGKGIAQAERLADLLTERDDTLDDRRACAECASLHDGRCLQGRYPVGQADIFTLHRCVGFKPDEVLNE